MTMLSPLRRLEHLERVQPYAQRGPLVDVGDALAMIYDAPRVPCWVRQSPEFESALERCYGDAGTIAPDDEHGAQWN